MGLRKIYAFYAEGFRDMKLGKVLWLIILVKLFVMFFILKLFFFPDFLGGLAEEEKEAYVSSELVERANSNF